MPEFNPEQFLDVEALDFYGPDYKNLKPLYEGKQAADVDASQPLPTQHTEPVSTPQEAPEEPLESDVDVSFSEVYRDITATVGADEADAVHEYMNDNSSQEEIADYMAYLKAGDQEAVAVFQAAKIAKDAGYEAEDYEASAITEETHNELVARFGDEGDQILELNRQLMAGQITDSQMRAKVIGDPNLLRTCLAAKAAGLLTF